MTCAPCAKRRQQAAGMLAASGGSSLTADSPAGTGARIAVYEVVKDGEVVTSTTSATAARSEAKRVGGSLRVTSRAADTGELEAAGLGGPD